MQVTVLRAWPGPSQRRQGESNDVPPGRGSRMSCGSASAEQNVLVLGRAKAASRRWARSREAGRDAGIVNCGPWPGPGLDRIGERIGMWDVGLGICGQ